MNVKRSDGPSVGGYGVGETRRCAVIRAWRASERDTQFCKSVRQAVSRSTWYRHMPYRNLLRTFDDHAASFGLSVDNDLGPAIADLSSPKKRRNNGGASSRKRRWLASPANSDPAPSSQYSQKAMALLRCSFPTTVLNSQSETLMDLESPCSISAAIKQLEGAPNPAKAPANRHKVVMLKKPRAPMDTVKAQFLIEKWCYYSFLNRHYANPPLELTTLDCLAAKRPLPC
ncbi:hypothetical protein B0H14DRAFT_3431613 [Mycena olivaceomarginata]|nr:hypothetical protein B0H14DRAFT_3431613 [Mycena olivaceomarginata]